MDWLVPTSLAVELEKTITKPITVKNTVEAPKAQ